MRVRTGMIRWMSISLLQLARTLRLALRIIKGELHMRNYKVFVVIMLGLTWAGIVRGEDQPIEQQLVDAMNKVFGAHPGFRANHAKGIVVEGNFKASAEAAGLSRAVLFNGSPIPATVRFSDSTGIPNIADGSSNANPHGMAIKFHLPDGSDADMVIALSA